MVDFGFSENRLGLSSIFNGLRSFKALVIGDFVLDAYTIGHVKRISPEAPVPVLEVLKQESRPGGAGNVVLSLASLGAEVSVVGRIGPDPEGLRLKQMLTHAKIDVSGLLEEKGYPTPIKTRFIANSQQLLRVDCEKVTALDALLEAEARFVLEKTIPSVQVIAISDYGKGFLSYRLIQEAISLAKKKNIPCIVDPKGIDFTKYRKATLLKPNLAEAYAAAKMPLSASLDDVAREIFQQTEVEHLLITRSEDGISLFDQKYGRKDFQVRTKEVKDVTGAGDTVLATVSFGLANGLDLETVVPLANVAAGLAIERIGCAQISLAEIAERLLEMDGENKIFAQRHAYALHQIFKRKKYALLVLDRVENFPVTLLKTIRQLSQEHCRELVLYVRDSDPSDECIRVLSSLSEIKAILLEKESLRSLCEVISPEEVFFLDKETVKEAKDLLACLIACSASESEPMGQTILQS